MEAVFCMADRAYGENDVKIRVGVQKALHLLLYMRVNCVSQSNYLAMEHCLWAFVAISGYHICVFCLVVKCGAIRDKKVFGLI